MKQAKKSMLFMALLFSICILSISSAFAAADSSHPLVTTTSDTVTVDYEVNDGYEWSYSSTYSETDKDAYLAGNSFKSGATISQIAFTVKEAGTFTFDYEISTNSSGATYMMAYSVNDEITLDNYKTTSMNSSTNYRGSVDWSTDTIIITEDMLENDSATVYIAYVCNSNYATASYYVAIANVEFVSGEREIDISATGGSVSGFTNGDTAVIGKEITLTASADSGNRFYGWVYNGEFQHCEDTFTFNVSVDESNSVEAVFAADGTYEARGGGTFYTADSGGLEKALTEAKSGETVMLFEDKTLTSDITIPTGVTLYIPFDENIYYDEETGEAVGFINGSNQQFATADDQYVQLTVPENVEIVVDGTLRVGGHNSSSMGDFQGHISGAYGEIVNNGTITTKDGSTLDVLGLITGSGVVNAESGSSVYEGFVVADFTGGTNTYGLFAENQAPFQHYGMQNIQTTFTIGSGSTLYGYCTLTTGSTTFNRTIAPIMSSDEQCLFQFASSGTTVTRTYSPDYVVDYDGLGKMTYVVEGGLTFQSLTMEIIGVEISTEGVSFPIPYTYEFILTDGNYEVANMITFLPGSVLTVASDATLTVPNNSYTYGDYTLYPALNILDGLKQSIMSSKRYPWAEELAAAGYDQSAMFTVNGTFEVENNAGFAGIVQTDGTGSIVLADDALLNMAKFQIGGLSNFDDNRAWMDLSARINTATGMGYMLAGEIYTATDGSDFTLPSYSLLYMVDSNLTTYQNRDQSLGLYDVGYMSETATYKTYHILEAETVSINQAMTGTWSGEVQSYQFYVNMSAADASDVEIGDTINVNLAIAGDADFGDAKFTVNYDSTVLEYVDSDLIADEDSYEYFGVNSSTIGEIVVSGSAFNDDGYDVMATGSYALGSLQFKVLETGVQTDLSVSEISINTVDSDTATLPGEGSTLTLTVGDIAVAAIVVDDGVYNATDDIYEATFALDVQLASNTNVTIDATTVGTEGVSTTSLTFPQTVASQFSGADNLIVETDAGVVTFNNAALCEISASQETTTTLVVSLFPAYTETTVSLELYGSDNEKITFAGDDDLGTATVTVPYEATNGENVKVYYINGTEKDEITNAIYDVTAQTVTFTTTHFSEFVISEEDAEEEVVVTINHVSYYTDGLAATEDSDFAYADGTVTFNISLGENSGLYTYQVTYTIDDVVTVVNGEDGTYTIENVTEALEITVTSYLLGDVDLSGEVDITDVTVLLRHVGYIDRIIDNNILDNIDFYNDDEVDITDVTVLLRHVGYVERLY